MTRKSKCSQNLQEGDEGKLPQRKQNEKNMKRISRQEQIPQRAVLTNLLELLGPLELVLPPELLAKNYLKLALKQGSPQELEEDKEPVLLLPC